jgi:hypothetical protein
VVKNLIGFAEIFYFLLSLFLRLFGRQFKFSKALMTIHLLVIKNHEDKVTQRFSY